MSTKIKLFLLVQIAVLFLLMGCSNNQPIIYTSFFSRRTYVKTQQVAEIYVTYSQNDRLHYVGNGTFFSLSAKPYSVILFYDGLRCVYNE